MFVSESTLLLASVLMPRYAESIAVAAPAVVLAWVEMVDVAVSLKVIFRLSPRSRLMPLNEASSANLSSWSFRSLNWVTRLLRPSLPWIEAVLAEPSTKGNDVRKSLVTQFDDLK